MPARSRPYHHGALRQSLLAAAEAILEREGLAALTLRAAAREAGVSHAAPAYHFGDLSGLLSELAAVGFARFGARLRSAAAATPADPLRAMGFAYVGFARAHPGMFTLMFRADRLNMQRPALRAAADAAWQALSAAAGAADAPPLNRLAGRIAPWALAHGLAVLLIDGRLQPALHELPGGARDIDALVAAVLAPDQNASDTA